MTALIRRDQSNLDGADPSYLASGHQTRRRPAGFPDHTIPNVFLANKISTVSGVIELRPTSDPNSPVGVLIKVSTFHVQRLFSSAHRVAVIFH